MSKAEKISNAYRALELEALGAPPAPAAPAKPKPKRDPVDGDVLDDPERAGLEAFLQVRYDGPITDMYATVERRYRAGRYDNDTPGIRPILEAMQERAAAARLATVNRPAPPLAAGESALDRLRSKDQDISTDDYDKSREAIKDALRREQIDRDRAALDAEAAKLAPKPEESK